jgi:hypothetical protein
MILPPSTFVMSSPFQPNSPVMGALLEVPLYSMSFAASVTFA